MAALTRLVRLLCVVVMAGVGLAVAVVLLAPQIRDFFTAGTTGPIKAIDLQPLAVRSVLYAGDGSVLATAHAEQDRVPVALDVVPDHVQRAVLDAEDDRFFEHGPLDIRALARALVTNVEGGGVFQGGSTITQQLVKTAILTPKQDVSRKIQEAALAIRLENQMSKRAIFERYLNTVYFGNGAYGIEAAAQTYFGIDVQTLSESQGILLASLIRNPVGGDPWAHPQEAISRRNVVIDRMRDLGHITPAQDEQFKNEPLPTPPPAPPEQGSDYFTQYVRDQLLADTRLGATQEERTNAYYEGGLQIFTTLDPKDQAMAEQTVASIVPDSGGQFGAAMVSLDPTTGFVKALVGGSGVSQSQYDLATDPPGRQVGSAFKMFTLEAAIEAGYLPADLINGSQPCPIPNPGTVDPKDAIWSPANVEPGFGIMTITDATVNSVNCAYARLIKLIGPQKVVDVAQRMGITSHLDPILSLTLGSDDVTPIEMATAYATLANDGMHHAPVSIVKVEDSTGKVLFRNDQTKPDRAISSQNARTVTQVLSQVIQRGTGTAAALPGWTSAEAGKTGSTDNNQNAWFVGFTHDLSTAVWMGSPGTVQLPMTNVGGITVFGGTYPAMIWGAYMKGVDSGVTPVPFAPPDQVVTRPPRQLVIAGESPLAGLTGNSGDTTGTANSPGTTAAGARGNSPATSPAAPATDNTDDTRTPRTSRVRPRDTASVP